MARVIRVYGSATPEAVDRVAGELAAVGVDAAAVTMHKVGDRDLVGDAVDVELAEEVDVEEESALRGLILTALAPPDPILARLERLEALVEQLVASSTSRQA